jgi:hypothetical protein
VLFIADVPAAFEQQPPGLSQDRVATFALHAAAFLRPNAVERLVHIGDDVEKIEDVQRRGASFADELQVSSHMSELMKQILETMLSPMEVKNHWNDSSVPSLADADVDLVYGRQILVAFGILNLIDANCSPKG